MNLYVALSAISTNFVATIACGSSKRSLAIRYERIYVLLEKMRHSDYPKGYLPPDYELRPILQDLQGLIHYKIISQLYRDLVVFESDLSLQYPLILGVSGVDHVQIDESKERCGHHAEGVWVFGIVVSSNSTSVLNDVSSGI